MPKAKKQPSCISTQTSFTSRFPPAPGPDLTSLSLSVLFRRRSSAVTSRAIQLRVFC